MKQYWNCSKFANILRGTSKREYNTSKGWKEWEEKAKKAHPFRYWLAEIGLDMAEDIFYYPYNIFCNIKYYIHNRWISKTNSLVAHKRDIKVGTWCEVGDRILPCLMNSLVDFVEIELANDFINWNQNENENRSFLNRLLRKFTTQRNPAAGIKNLEKMTTLTYGEEGFIDKNNKLYGKPTIQAINAKETLEVYLWWTTTYPKRISPMKASGWSEYCDLQRKKSGSSLGILDTEDDTPKMNKMRDEALKKLEKIENDYHEEETKYMTKLIKVRDFLWT